MKLKRLSLHGYKTFASKTDFVFDEGITAIVGPNGSGKSNIADAVRWVLGEQSYSMLRGKRTTDMIFAGSHERPRAGMAQAILTLDNSDGWLPLEFSEIEIGRRAYRSGENEYILNGQRVRLRDLTELLAKSGLSERTYTIIGQGLVDQALSLRAEERRALFEEAAGITHYKTKRAETLRRLEQTQHNLERVHDLLSEIRPRLSSLKRQAGRAETYQQLTADLRQLLRIWYGYHWDQARSTLRRQRQDAQEAHEMWESARRERSDLARAINERRRLTSARRQNLTEQEEGLAKLRGEVEIAHRRVAVLEERQQSLHRRLVAINNDSPRLDEQRQAAQAELDRALQELSQAQEMLEEQASRRQEFQLSVKSEQNKIENWRENVSMLESQRMLELSRLAQAEGQLSQLLQRLSDRQSLAAVTTRISQLEAEMAQGKAQIEQGQRDVQSARNKRVAVQQKRREHIQKLNEIRQSASQSERKIALLSNEVARVRERYEILDQLRHKEGVARKLKSVVGRLAAQISIPAEYRATIELTLAERLTTVVVANEEGLWQLLEDYSDQPLFAAVNNQLEPPAPLVLPRDPAVIGLASELVQAEPEAEKLVALLLNRIVVISDAQAAYEVALQLPTGAQAVTPDGFLAYAGGLVEIRPATQTSMLTAEEQRSQASADLSDLETRLAQATAESSEWYSLLEQQQSTIDRLNSLEKQLFQQEQRAFQHLVKSQRAMDRLSEQHSFLTAQHAANSEEAVRLEKQHTDLTHAIQIQRQALAKMEAALSEAKRHLEALPVVEIEQQQMSVRQQFEAAQTIVAGRRAVVDGRQATLHQIEEQIRRLEAQKQEIAHEAQQLDLDGARTELERLQVELSSWTAKIGPLRQLVDATQDKVDQLEMESADAERRGQELEAFYTQARISLGQAESGIENLRERIRADLGLVALEYDDGQMGQAPLPIAEVVEKLPSTSKLPEDIEETIRRYRGQLTRAGTVNPDAPSEYKETLARFKFLNQQVEDLVSTRSRLHHVISELDDLTSRSFSATVEEVNTVFGHVFKRLFGGGSAQLVLTDSDDPTTSGVEIVARLPNRREQSLALLSGGERSLTAAALIFALLKVAPTPFCILDEVDAMLDEANVGRFRELLVELSEPTQFVIITHNRGTVQAAQTVYGVSIGADSISQVISIRPEEYVAPG